MVEYFNDLWQFVVNVVWDWGNAATGGVIVALLWLWSVVIGPVSRKVSIAIAILFLLLAGFNAWRSEYHAKLAAQQVKVAVEKKLNDLTVPKLDCKITTMATAKLKHGDKNSFLVVGGTITNRGGPTVLDLWRIAIRFHDGSILRPEPMVPLGPGGRLSIGGGALGFDAEDWWAYKAASNPIVTGGAAAGWLYFVIRGLPTDEYWDRRPVAIILNVTDVNGKEWSFEQAMDGQDSPPVSPGEFIEIEKNGSHPSENGRIYRKPTDH